MTTYDPQLIEVFFRYVPQITREYCTWQPKHETISNLGLCVNICKHSDIGFSFRFVTKSKKENSRLVITNKICYDIFFELVHFKADFNWTFNCNFLQQSTLPKFVRIAKKFSLPIKIASKCKKLINNYILKLSYTVFYLFAFFTLRNSKSFQGLGNKKHIMMNILVLL